MKDKQDFEVVDIYANVYIIAVNKEGVLFNLGVLEENPQVDRAYAFKKTTIFIGQQIYVAPVGQVEQVFFKGKIEYRQKNN